MKTIEILYSALHMDGCVSIFEDRYRGERMLSSRQIAKLSVSQADELVKSLSASIHDAAAPSRLDSQGGPVSVPEYVVRLHKRLCRNGATPFQSLLRSRLGLHRASTLHDVLQSLERSNLGPADLAKLRRKIDASRAGSPCALPDENPVSSGRVSSSAIRKGSRPVSLPRSAGDSK